MQATQIFVLWCDGHRTHIHSQQRVTERAAEYGKSSSSFFPLLHHHHGSKFIQARQWENKGPLCTSIRPQIWILKVVCLFVLQGSFIDRITGSFKVRVWQFLAPFVNLRRFVNHLLTILDHVKCSMDHPWFSILNLNLNLVPCDGWCRLLL